MTFDGECLELNDQYSIGDAAREGPQAILGAALASVQSGAPVIPCLAPAGAEPDCDIYDTDANITVPATHVIIPPSPGYVLENDCEPVPLPLEAARRLYADPDTEDLAERPAKAHTRFGGLNASQGSVLPEIDYWDAERLLPRIPGEGCVGYMIGDTGSHKTGTAIMLALNAIEEKGGSSTLLRRVVGACRPNGCPRHGGRVGRNSLCSIRTGAWRLQISTLPVRRTGGS